MAYKNPEDQKAAAKRHYEANKEKIKERKRLAYLKEKEEGKIVPIVCECGGSYICSAKTRHFTTENNLCRFFVERGEGVRCDQELQVSSGSSNRVQFICCCLIFLPPVFIWVVDSSLLNSS
jgi:hypothetical protein